VSVVVRGRDGKLADQEVTATDLRAIKRAGSDDRQARSPSLEIDST
jgi:hypothetical protein